MRTAETTASDARTRDADAMSVPSREVFVAAGLLDPGSPVCAERLNLLRVIAARGGTVEDMRTADARGGLVQLAGELWQHRSGRHTLNQVAESRGVQPSRLERLRLACQLPPVAADEPSLHDGDVDLIDAYLAAGRLFGDEAAIELVRVVAASAMRVADAVISVYTTSAGPGSLVDDTTLVDVTARARGLRNALPAVLDTLLGHHMTRLARPNVTGRTPGFDTRSGTIGFVDLVEFTARTSATELDQLAELLSEFEADTADMITREDGRIIKFLGDGVMFWADELDAGCRIALGLSDTSDKAAYGEMRAALAVGEMLVREGDCFGPVVNLAARAVQACEPGQLVIAGPLVDPFSPEFTLTRLADARLRGVPGLTELRRVSRSTDTETGAAVVHPAEPPSHSSAPRHWSPALDSTRIRA